MADSPTTHHAALNTKQGPWLHAWFDPLAALRTVTSCVRLGDLFADGDSKLLICDLSKKLKIYKGTAIIAEHDLLDQPVACCIFHTDNNVVRIYRKHVIF
jgi:hypothetical protein